MRRIYISLASCLICASALAGEADVVGVKVTAESGGTFAFDVTVRHNDAGWAHYADKWEVMGADGTVYGTRMLAHPHDDEQPFTRSQSGIVIPEGVELVTVRAHDLVHEFGGKEMTVALPGR
jgi:hypothetical protein